MTSTKESGRPESDYLWLKEMHRKDMGRIYELEKDLQRQKNILNQTFSDFLINIAIQYGEEVTDPEEGVIGYRLDVDFRRPYKALEDKYSSSIVLKEVYHGDERHEVVCICATKEVD